MELGEKLGEGRVAEIYAWGPGQVIKLYRCGYPRGGAEAERLITQYAHTAGAPAPACGELIRVQNRIGLVMERMPGLSLRELISRHPLSLARWADILARQQTCVHSFSGRNLSPAADYFAECIQTQHILPEPVKKALLFRLSLLEQGDVCCHMDFHPENVLVNGEVCHVIDWVNALSGHPAADVARTVYLLRYSGLPQGFFSRKWALTARRLFISCYRQAILRYNPALIEELIDAWIPIIAASRLAEAVAEEQPEILRLLGVRVCSKRQPFGVRPPS